MSTIQWVTTAYLLALGIAVPLSTWGQQRFGGKRLWMVAFLGLDQRQIAHSSVLTRTVQQIGGSFGTAVLAVILSGGIAAHHGRPATAFDAVFWWATGFSALAVLLALWLPKPST